jgi:hypothetical protein
MRKISFFVIAAAWILAAGWIAIGGPDRGKTTPARWTEGRGGSEIKGATSVGGGLYVTPPPIY